jgi:chromosome segregation ATPase
MSENVTNDFFVETHIKSHETLILDLSKKVVENTTKVTFLERAVSESRKQIDDLTVQYNNSQTALQQAVNGLQAMSAEKEKLSFELEEEKKDHDKTREIYKDYKGSAERTINELNVRNNELDSKYTQLNTKVEVYISDNSTLKKNYNRVLEELSNLKQSLPKPVEVIEDSNIIELGKKSKNKKTVSEEWIDAD